MFRNSFVRSCVRRYNHRLHGALEQYTGRLSPTPNFGLFSPKNNVIIDRFRSISHSARYYKDNIQQKSNAIDQDRHGMIVEFERALFRRLEGAGFKRSKLFYWIVSISSAMLVIVAGYLYFFPHKLRQQVVEEVSTVASASLEDEQIAIKAEQLSKDILNGILNDVKTKAVASDFVKDIIMSTPTKDAAIGTVLGLMNDSKVLELLRKRLTEIILNILQNDATKQVVLSQVNSILQHESIQHSLQCLLRELLDTPEVKVLMANFFKEVLSSETVQNQGKLLGQQVTTDVITSKEIQEKAGDALWSAMKFSIIPNLFKSKTVKERNDVETVSPALNEEFNEKTNSPVKENIVIVTQTDEETNSPVKENIVIVTHTDKGMNSTDNEKIANTAVGDPLEPGEIDTEYINVEDYDKCNNGDESLT